MRRWDDLDLLAALVVSIAAAWIGVAFGGV